MHKNTTQVRGADYAVNPEAMHDLGARLKDGVELGAVFEDFPRALEPCRHNESGTGTEFPSIALPVFEHHPAAREATELRLG